MGEDWLTQMVSDRWFPAAVAYFLGLITGWLIWSGGKARAGRADEAAVNGSLDEAADGLAKEKREPVVESASAAIEEKNGDKEPVAMKIGALESEIKKAREMIAEDAEENAAFAELLSNLDEAVKRANGRLKLIIKSVKRAKIDD